MRSRQWHVVGGSGGIGRAVSRMLLARGSAVAVTYRNNADAVEQFGVSAFQLDATDSKAARTVVSSAVRDFGELHTLVYAAGPHVPMKHLSKVTPEDFRTQLIEDVSAFFNVVSGALDAARANTPLRRFETADDVAEAVCFLASARAGFISGQKLDVDGGYGV